MSKKREMKWYEDAFLGLLYLVIIIMIIFNRFSALANRFLTEEELTSGATKEKAIFSIVAWLENTIWKYPIIAIFGLFSYLAISTSIKKYKKINLK